MIELEILSVLLEVVIGLCGLTGVEEFIEDAEFGPLQLFYFGVEI